MAILFSMLLPSSQACLRDLPIDPLKKGLNVFTPLQTLIGRYPSLRNWAVSSGKDTLM
jgi:hypothetical protein